MNKWKKSFLAVLGVVLLCGIVSAQAPSPRGTIYGVVSDSEGNPLPGVAVEATSPRLIGKASVVTDAAGIYRLFALTPGTYKITFTLQGFKPFIRDGIVITIDQSLKLDITMEMGTLEEEVTVIGRSPIIDVKSTTKGMTLTKDTFEMLPRGRNFDTLVSVVPGVNTEPWLGGISVDGASGAENMFYMDGTDITTTNTGVRGQSAAFEFVEEVKITASGYPAEFGGALGGVVSVVTRQGGNEYHGELIGYYEGSKLTGKERDSLRLNPYDITVAEYVNYQDLYGKDLRHRYEGGFSLGGYILRDRLWFFGSVLPVYTPTTRTVDYLSTTEPDNLKYTSKSYAYNFQAKVTAQPAGFMRIGASFVNNFSKYKGNLPGRDGTGNIADVYGDYGYSYPNYTVQGFADMTFGNNFMVNARGGRFFSNVTDQLVNATFPRKALSGNGIGVFLPSTDPLYRVRGWANRGRIYEIKKSIKYKNYGNADFTYYLNLAGEHAFKFGVGYVRQGEDEDSSISSQYPEVYFNWGRPFILAGINYMPSYANNATSDDEGTVYGYYEVRGNTETGPFGGFWNVYNERWALYLQDAWTIADRFTLNVGIRAETEYLPPYTASLPAGYETWRPMEFGWGDKLAPRVGFIYDVFGDASLKIFGSYGLYFDVIKTYMAAHSYAGFKWKSAYYRLTTLDWPSITGAHDPDNWMVTFDWRHPSFESTDPDLRPVSQREFSFGAEKMLMENLSVTARLVQKHLLYMIEDVGVLVPGLGEVYYEANPGYGYTLHQGNGTGKFDPTYPETPKAKREYWGLNFSIDKRLANNWLAGASYTWSRLTGNNSGLGASDEFGRVSPYVERAFDNWSMSITKDLSYVDGPLPTDRPHFFKFYGAYTFPFRLTVGAVVNAMSGTPFTETWYLLGIYWYPFNRGNYRPGDSGTDLVQKRTPFLWFANAYAEYNLRLGKTTLQLNVNVDNIFNIKTARALSQGRNLYGLDVDEATVLGANWDITGGAHGHVESPTFLMPYYFYDPLAVRFGVKFIF